MRVLQIQADASTADSIELYLKAEGFKVYTTDLGEEGADLAKLYDYDAILLDAALPDMTGLDLLRTLRRNAIATPVLILTRGQRVEDEVSCFAAGADDFIRTPLHRDVLVARLHAVIRRSKGHARNLIEVGSISVDVDQKLVFIGGENLHLTGREYQILELLALRRDMTLTKDMFLNHLYGGMDEPELKIIDVFICKIRNKLRPYGVDGRLETVWGRGYRLVAEPSVKDVPEPVATGRIPFRTLILSRLREGPATFRDVCQAVPDASHLTLRALLSNLLGAGLVLNSGDLRSALYVLKAAKAAA